MELATKFGINNHIVDTNLVVRGDPAYVRAACEESLKRLDVHCIDLYYQHRVDTNVPIEVTVCPIYFFTLLVRSRLCHSVTIASCNMLSLL